MVPHEDGDPAAAQTRQSEFMKEDRRKTNTVSQTFYTPFLGQETKTLPWGLTTFISKNKKRWWVGDIANGKPQDNHTNMMAINHVIQASPSIYEVS